MVQGVSVGTLFLNHKIPVPSPFQPLTHESTLQATPHCEDTTDRDVRVTSHTQRFSQGYSHFSDESYKNSCMEPGTLWTHFREDKK